MAGGKVIAAIIRNVQSDANNRTITFDIDDSSYTGMQITVPASNTAAQDNAAVVAMAAAETNVATNQVKIFGGAQ